MSATTFGDQERRRIKDAVRKVEHQTGPPSGRQRHTAENPPVVFMLLEDLHGGFTARAAVLRRQVSHHTQIVTVVGGTQIQPGEATGSFRLKWDPSNIEDDPLPDDTPLQTGSISAVATGADVRAAMAQHPLISANDVEVTVGGDLSRWFIKFTGIYAGKDVPLLQPHEDDDDFVGFRASVEVSGITEAEDTGFEITLRAVIPTDTLMASRNNPITRFTPLRKGAIGTAKSIPGWGYVPDSIEPRELFIDAEVDPPEPTDFAGTHAGDGPVNADGTFSGSGTGTVGGSIEGGYTIEFTGSGSATSGTFSGSVAGAINGTFTGSYVDDGSGIVAQTTYDLAEGTATGSSFEITFAFPTLTFNGSLIGIRED